MNRRSCIILRPVVLLVFMMLVVFCLAGSLIPLWKNNVKRIENEVKSTTHITAQELLLKTQKTAMLISPNNASAMNLVRLLSSSLDHNKLHFSKIESEIAPALFQAFSTIPYLSQISFIGLNGLFFAYYMKGNQPYALYSNSTFSSTREKNYIWYMQPAKRNTGKLYGEAIKSPPFTLVNSSWFQEALNSRDVYASVGTGYGNSQDILLLSTAGMDGKGAISLGFSMKSLSDFLIADIAVYNGSLYLATMDGNVLTSQDIPNTHMIMSGNQVSFQLLGHDGDRVRTVENITCESDNSTYEDYSTLNILGRKYVIKCLPVEIAGLQLRYVLALPRDEISRRIHINIRSAFILLLLMIGAVVITICTFVYLIIGAARREMHLCHALINQMEATQQSERKSMNKSLAFASASHDIRASLAGISGLIEICRNEVSRRNPLQSEMLTNLQQMEACTKDLLGILNSILDTSKIEAGKMQLEEEEFDIEQLLEDVVDLYHPVGMKKNVDVILDPYDGSIMKLSRVIGDRGKLRQILSNLLSNAVKFTSEGHVTVRAWARKPSHENEILTSNGSNFISRWLLCLFKTQRTHSEPEAVNAIQIDQNCMEYVFEVNDTGKGIPKEKQKSVFENYVQVKETLLGQEGTGLGLGIVQSLVRLMGGEIAIVDKEDGERGTCFRFNVFFSTCEIRTDIEEGESFHQLGSSLRNLSPKTEGSQVVLLTQSAKRSQVMQNYMRKFGIKVHVVKQHEQLSQTLKRIKQKRNLSNYSSSGNSRSDGHGSYGSSMRLKEFPLSALDGVDDFLPSQKKANRHGGLSGFVLVVIDTSARPFREISRAVAELRRDLNNENWCTRVVWLDKTDASSTNFQGLDEGKLPPSDLVISKPFHGSRLYQVLGLLPEFGGVRPSRIGETSNNVEGVQPRCMSSSDAVSTVSVKGKFSGESQKGEIEEVGRVNNGKPLMGKKILVIDDDPIGRKIATFVASQLGANTFSCGNGEEARKLVCENLKDETNAPFDCILMDCEMPVMDGTEATLQIRAAEKSCGVHIPIIALTAHKRGVEIDKMINAGVDGYLTKPLNKENFLKAVSELIITT